MPPMSAAAMPRSSVSGPMLHEVGRALVGRGQDDRDRRQEPGDRPDRGRHSFGLMPVRRARSTFVADARTASPNAVCPSSHHRPSVMSGTTMRTSTWLALTVDVEAGMPVAR